MTVFSLAPLTNSLPTKLTQKTLCRGPSSTTNTTLRSPVLLPSRIVTRTFV